MDSLGLGLATSVVPVLEEGEGGGAGPTPPGPFDWDDYTDLKERYVLNELGNHYAKKANTFNEKIYLTTDSAVATNVPLTICGNFKTAATGIAMVLIGDKSESDEFLDVYISATGSVNQYIESALDGGAINASASGGYNDNAWHWFGAVYESATSRKIYVDSEAAVTDTTSVTIGGTYDQTAIAAKAIDAVTIPFTGALDNFLIFNVALSADEIAYVRTNASTYESLVIDYAAGETNCPNPANVVGAWKLQEDDGLRRDSSGNDAHMVARQTKRVANFVKGSSDLLRNTSASPQATMPMTMICWHKSSDSGSLGNFLTNRNSTGTNYYILYKTAANEVGFKKRNGTTTIGVVVPVADVDASDGAWHMSSGVAASATSIICYSDQHTSPEDTTSNTPSSIADFDVGAWVTSQYVTAELAWGMVYSKAITRNEHLWLWNGGRGRSKYELANSTHPYNPGEPDHLWKMDETSGNRLDEYGSFTLTDASSVGSVNTEDGYRHWPTQLDGTAYSIAELENTAMEFDGLDDGLTDTTANFRGSDTSGSVSWWFKCNSDATSQYMFQMGTTGGTDDEIGFYLFNGIPRILRNIGGAGADACQFGSTDWRDGQWHHIVYTSTGTEYFCWVDGVAQTPGSNNDGTWFGDVGTTGTQTIASDHNSAIHFLGAMDEVAVWSGQLTATEVALLYAGGAGLTSEGLDSNDQLNGIQCVNWWGLNTWGRGGSLGDSVGTLVWTKVSAPFAIPGIPAGQASGLVELSQGEISASNKLVGTAQIVESSTGTGYVLYTNGTSNYMQAGPFAVDLSQPNTIFFVVELIDEGVGTVVVDGLEAAKEQAIHFDSTQAMAMDAGSRQVMTLTGDKGNVHIWAATFNGASSKLWRSGGVGETAPATIGAEAMSGITIGARYDGAGANPAKYEYYVVNNGLLSLADINAIGAQLAVETSGSWTTAT